jgi:hypothetical protein
VIRLSEGVRSERQHHSSELYESPNEHHQQDKDKTIHPAYNRTRGDGVSGKRRAGLTLLDHAGGAEPPPYSYLSKNAVKVGQYEALCS